MEMFYECEVEAKIKKEKRKYNRLKRASLALARICKEHVTSGRRHDLYSAVVLFEDATGLKVETEP